MHSKRTRDYDFSKRASSYDEGFEGKASKKFYNLLLREIELSPGMVVLDSGCGTGALLSKLAAKPGITWHGIDVEEKMLAEARKKCPQINFQIARSDKTPFSDNMFDTIIACNSFHHFDNKTGFTKEAARILKPGGILTLPSPASPGSSAKP